MKPIIVISIIIFNCISYSAYAQETHGSVFQNPNQWIFYRNPQYALYNVIYAEAVELLGNRANRVSTFKTEADWLSHQEISRNTLCPHCPKFERGFLNPRVTGVLERESFTVEKLIFESHPGFYVTAALFLPEEGNFPAPAILYVSGHSAEGFRAGAYQQFIINMVKKGFVVLAIDPIGQGERLQYVNVETGTSKIGGVTSEHNYAGVQTLLNGVSLCDYFIWDGIRAIDFLESRAEVDKNRIGIAGRSGGGNQSAKIGAYDERIYASAPENYITDYKRLLQSLPTPDAEQNPYFAIKNGFDFPDYFHARAPKPSLIVTTTNDIRNIYGAYQSYREALKSYTFSGKPENIMLIEDYAGHQSTVKNREATYAFFQKHLELPGSSTDESVELFSMDELRVTPTGQLATSFKGETVHSLNLKYFNASDIVTDELPQLIARTAGIDFNLLLTDAVYTGKYIGEDNEVRKFFLENNRGNYALPVYVVVKSEYDPERVILWLHPDGKSKVLDSPFLNRLLEAGYTVITCDLPGSGELFDKDLRGRGFLADIPAGQTFTEYMQGSHVEDFYGGRLRNMYAEKMGANLVGKSIAGIQAEAIDLLMQFLEQYASCDQLAPDAIVEGMAGQAFLHYTSQNERFNRIVLVNQPPGNRVLVEQQYFDPEHAFYVVPGSLPYYDMNDLISLLPAEKYLTIGNGENIGGEIPPRSFDDIIQYLRKE